MPHEFVTTIGSSFLSPSSEDEPQNVEQGMLNVEVKDARSYFIIRSSLFDILRFETRNLRFFRRAAFPSQSFFGQPTPTKSIVVIH